MADNLLPSPSSFYPDWGFGGRSSGHDSGMLPSPLTFPTPVVTVGGPQGWGRQTSDPGMAGLGPGIGGGPAGGGEKRKESSSGGSGGSGGEDRGADGGAAKKVKV